MYESVHTCARVCLCVCACVCVCPLFSPLPLLLSFLPLESVTPLQVLSPSGKRGLLGPKTQHSWNLLNGLSGEKMSKFEIGSNLGDVYSCMCSSCWLNFESVCSLLSRINAFHLIIKNL